ncbi:MAG TPA: hypothetical protein VFY39_01355 [Gammaproteobacteria bacterium]|nr:hypothetical protein [Gammaproteobacteria bacterium]
MRSAPARPRTRAYGWIFWAAPALFGAALAAACAGPEVVAAPLGEGAAAGASEPFDGGKPVAPFALEYRLAGAPAVGQPLEITLTVRPRSPMSELELHAAGESALQVNAESAEQTAASATAEDPAVWSVTVVPQQEGVSYLKLTASGIIAGRRQARSIAVPIRVGGNRGTGGKPSTSTESAPKTEQGQGDGLIHLHSD